MKLKYGHIASHFMDMISEEQQSTFAMASRVLIMKESGDCLKSFPEGHKREMVYLLIGIPYFIAIMEMSYGKTWDKQVEAEFNDVDSVMAWFKDLGIDGHILGVGMLDFLIGECVENARNCIPQDKPMIHQAGEFLCKAICAKVEKEAHVLKYLQDHDLVEA